MVKLQWLMMHIKFVESYEEENSLLNPQQRKLVNELKKNVVTLKYLGYGDLQNIACTQILNPITKAGTPVMSVIEAMLPVVEEELKK